MYLIYYKKLGAWPCMNKSAMSFFFNFTSGVEWYIYSHDTFKRPLAASGLVRLQRYGKSSSHFQTICNVRTSPGKVNRSIGMGKNKT